MAARRAVGAPWVDLALAGCSGPGGSRTDVERVLFALVANHALDSCSSSRRQSGQRRHVGGQDRTARESTAAGAAVGGGQTASRQTSGGSSHDGNRVSGVVVDAGQLVRRGRIAVLKAGQLRVRCGGPDGKPLLSRILEAVLLTGHRTPSLRHRGHAALSEAFVVLGRHDDALRPEAGVLQSVT